MSLHAVSQVRGTTDQGTGSTLERRELHSEAADYEDEDEQKQTKA